MDKIYELINTYISNNSENDYIIPYELTSVQRAEIHEYVRNKGLYTQSIIIPGSGYKKIRIIKSLAIKKESYIQEDIDFFVEYTNIPFPCTLPEYLPYYVDLFDPLYNTKYLWNLFLEEFNTNLRRKSVETMVKLRKFLEDSKEYNDAINNKVENSVKIIMRKDVYNLENVGKYFLSIDIKSANFTVLKHICPLLFTTDNPSWYDFIKQFSDSEFIARSKFFRELFFGLSGFVHKARCYQEQFMDKIYNLINCYCDEEKMILKMKAGDEIVYEVSDKFNNDNIKKIMDLIGSDICKDLHFRVFRVDQIHNKKYFLKTFIFNTDVDTDTDTYSLKSKIEFKNVPKNLVAQTIKWYMKQPITKPDLMFIHDGMVARYTKPFFSY